MIARQTPAEVDAMIPGPAIVPTDADLEREQTRRAAAAGFVEVPLGPESAAAIFQRNTAHLPDAALREMLSRNPAEDVPVMARAELRRRHPVVVGSSGLAAPLSTISGDPPEPLIIDRLDPEGQTILYGTGGAGKGTLTASWIVQLVKAGHRVLVLDYENHPGEWRRRVEGLGGPDAVAGVDWAGPLTARWTDQRGPLWTRADEIRDITEDLGTTYLVVDSIVFACSGGDPIKPEIAALYAGGLEYIGLPTLSLAHVTKAEDLRYPFGSAFWHNAARTTWSLKKTSETAAILAHQKHNNYASLGRFMVETTWRDDLPREVWERGYSIALADRITEVLAGGPMTIEAIVDELSEEAEPPKANSVRTALRRGLKADRFRLSGSDWGLVE